MNYSALGNYLSIAVLFLLLAGAIHLLNRKVFKEQSLKHFKYFFLLMTCFWFLRALELNSLKALGASLSAFAFVFLYSGLMLRQNRQPNYKVVNLGALLSIFFMVSYFHDPVSIWPVWLSGLVFFIPISIYCAYLSWSRKPDNNFADRAISAALIFFLCAYLTRLFIAGANLTLSFDNLSWLMWQLIMPSVNMVIGIGILVSYMLQAKQKLRELSIRDPLTNLLNRRGFEEASHAQLALLARQKSDVTLVVLDIDFFKKLNDTYGHAAGDQALIDIATILNTETRDNDLVVRNGGEEFVLLLPSLDEKQAKQVAERIRKAIAKHTIVYEQLSINTSASFGVYSTAAVDLEIKSAIDFADQALYKAKQTGRNKTCLFSELGS